MTQLERFNLYWLCHAMTVPLTSTDLYYFDGQTKRFFVKKSDVLFDMVDLPLMPSQAEEFSNRLADIDSEASEIVEIPRLDLPDKVSVQLLFLSKFPGIIHEEKLRLAVELQEDKPGFLLDKLEETDPTLSPLQGYWEDFKLKTIQYYLEKFTGIIGITLKMF